ncbi:MAG: hypothetical protein LUC89_03875 [Oscillospiraceae bacterium]|nr:hypothetical protein [Oscillospiraceae bacterium]
MKASKRLLSALLVLTLLFALGVTAMASSEASGEAEVEAAAGEEILIEETTAYPDGLTIEEGVTYVAPDGYCVIMTVDGVTMTQAAGTYEGEVVLEVVPLTTSDNGSEEFQTQSLLTKDEDELIVAESGVNGEYDENGITGADITADQASMSVVTVINGEYSISDSTFHILQTGNHESGGNDFTGEGCAIAVTGDSTVYIDNVTVVGDGVTRTALFGGLSTHDSYPTVYVSNSSLTSTGDAEAEDAAVWVLGLHGVVRTCQYCDYYDIYYYNTTIDSFGWASLSVDGTEAPTAEDLEELTAAYVEGEGYANEDGEIMTLAEFAVAATGLTDEYLAELDAVESAEDLQALENTNDYSLYYYTGKNTLVDSTLTILDIDTTGTGYSSYSIGSNINVYSGCVVDASYGNVEANEYASSAYVNGTVVDATKSIVMCHSNAGGITFVADSVLNAGEIAFIYKGTGDGYTQDNIDEDASSSEMIAGATGSNLYVRNSLINAPVLVLTFDSDDPGSTGGTTIEIDDSIAPKDESFDVTNANSWGAASTMWADGTGYNYNAAVEAYFEDCTGETALVGDIYNCHQFTSKNLIVTLDNSELTGVISSGYAEHDVDIIDREMSSTDEDYVGEDGLVYGNRENLGEVTCYASETVNNGVILTLTNGAVWNVTETSYVSVLNVDETSTVNGTITVLDSGIIMVEPLEAEAETEDEVPATDGTENQANTLAGDTSVAPETEEEFEAYKEYLTEYMTNYSGEGDGTGFDDSARSMALSELTSVGFGADVYAFPFEMYVTQFGAMDYASFAAGGDDTAAEAADGSASDLEAYKDYLREQLAADGGPDEFKAEMNAQIDSAETTDSENFATLIEFGIAVSYDNWAAGMLETSGAPVAY